MAPMDNWGDMSSYGSGMGSNDFAGLSGMPGLFGGRQSKLFKTVYAVGHALDSLVLLKISKAERIIDRIYSKARRAGGSASFGGSLLNMGTVSAASGSSSIGLGTVGGNPVVGSGAFRAEMNGTIHRPGPGSDLELYKPLPTRYFPQTAQPVPLASPMSGRTAGLLGLGAVTAGIGAVGFGMMPNVKDAVNQNLLAQSVSIVNGMPINSVIAQANKALSGGMTSNMAGAATAASMLYQGGILMNTQSGRNILGSVGGFSALTGMSNERVAAASSTINGMNMLRVGGIQARDRQGNLLGADKIAAQLYQKTWGSRKVSMSDAASVYNSGTIAYANTMAAAGGNQDLFDMLASYQVQMAKNGGKALNMNPNKVMDTMGLDKNSPYRKNFRVQESEARKLEDTQKGLVEGYTAAQGAIIHLNNAFSDLAETLPGVTEAFGKIAGFSTSFPQMGNTGSAVSGLFGSIAHGAGSLLGDYMAFRGIQRAFGMAPTSMKNFFGFGAKAGSEAAAGENVIRMTRGADGVYRAGKVASSASILGKLFKGGIPNALKGSLGKMGTFGKVLKFAGGKLLPGIGAAYTLYDTSHVAGDDKNNGGWNWAHFGESALSGAISGLTMGGGWGAVAGAVVNAANYGISYAHGRGGDDSGASFANLAEEGRGGSYSGRAYSYPTHGRSPQEAVRWALNEAKTGSGQPGGGSWKGFCERFTRTAYGYPGLYPSAIAHWRDSVRTGRSHPGDLNPPAGALVFWSGGSKKYGHVALSIGGGNVVSTDAKRPGKADVVSIAHINRTWRSFKYEGWSDPMHTKLSPGSSTAGAQTPLINSTSSSVVNSTTSSAGSSTRAFNSYGMSSQDAAPSGSPMTDDFSSVVSLNDSFNAKLLSNISVASLGSSGRGGGPQDSFGTPNINGYMASSDIGGRHRPYNINMTVKIERATVESAAKLAKTIKKILERDAEMSGVGKF